MRVRSAATALRWVEFGQPGDLLGAQPLGLGLLAVVPHFESGDRRQDRERGDDDAEQRRSSAGQPDQSGAHRAECGDHRDTQQPPGERAGPVQAGVVEDLAVDQRRHQRELVDLARYELVGDHRHRAERQRQQGTRPPERQPGAGHRERHQRPRRKLARHAVRNHQHAGADHVRGTRDQQVTPQSPDHPPH